ncbi:hypothetical protein V6M85_09405 [Sulfolobus tengchongensis]|uniref:Uncharacterized protein n=1 Tax=Sulfolobus tengchongensis TaxID=207809 RepID=A0AAX4KXS3_9CREN
MIRVEIPRKIYSTFEEIIKNKAISVTEDTMLLSLNDSLIEIESYVTGNSDNITFYYGEDKLCEIFNLLEVSDYVSQGVYKFNNQKDSIIHCLLSVSKFVKEKGIEVSSNRYLYVNSEIFNSIMKKIEEKYSILGKHAIEGEIQYAIRNRNKITIISIISTLIESRGMRRVYGFGNLESEDDITQIVVLFSDRIYYLDKLKFENIDDLEIGIDKMVTYIIEYEEDNIENETYLLLTINNQGTFVDRLIVMRSIIDNISDLVSDIDLKLTFGYFNGDFDLKIIKNGDVIEVGKIKGNKMFTINGYESISEGYEGIRRLIEIGIEKLKEESTS